MEQNLTALLSCYARAYHHRNRLHQVFDDAYAEALLSRSELKAIPRHLTQGASFFLPGFSGTDEEALRRINDRFLAPPVLARSAFCEDALNTAVKLGCGQYVLFGAGYDTFPFRCPHSGLRSFLLDRPEMLADRDARQTRAGLAEICPTAHIPCDLAGEDWPPPSQRRALTAEGPPSAACWALCTT